MVAVFSWEPFTYPDPEEKNIGYPARLHDAAISVHPNFHFDRDVMYFWESLYQKHWKEFPRVSSGLERYDPGSNIYQSRKHYAQVAKFYAYEMLTYPERYAYELEWIRKQFASDPIVERLSHVWEIDLAVLGNSQILENIDRAQAASHLVHQLLETGVRVRRILLSWWGDISSETEASILHSVMQKHHPKLPYQFEEDSYSTFDNIRNLQPHFSDIDTVILTANFHLPRVNQTLEITLGSQRENGYSAWISKRWDHKLLETYLQTSEDTNRHSLASYNMHVVWAQDWYAQSYRHQLDPQIILEWYLMETLFLVDNYRRTEENRKHNKHTYRLGLKDQDGYHTLTKESYDFSILHRQIRSTIDTTIEKKQDESWR